MSAFATPCRKGWGKALIFSKLCQGAGNEALSRVVLPPPAKKVGGRHQFSQSYAEGLALKPYRACFHHRYQKRLGKGANFL